MACIRMELAVKRLNNEKNIYDCLVEETDDFTEDTNLTTVCGEGSMALCLEDQKVYALTTDGWEAVDGESS